MRIAGLDITVDRTAYPALGILGLIPVALRGGYAVLAGRRDQRLQTVLTAPVLGVGSSPITPWRSSSIRSGMRWRRGLPATR